MEHIHVARKANNGPKGYQLLTLTSPNHMELLCPIRYIYNYLPHETEWLKSQPISLGRILAESKDCKSAFIDNQAKGRNSICIHTREANLPLHTGLENFRQNIYWRASEKATKELLELFAQDRHCSEVILSDKRSMSSLAEDQLKTAVLDTYSRFGVYMFPEADETRIQLLTQSVILIFMFDGKQILLLWNEVTVVYSNTHKERGLADPAPDVWENASPKTVTYSIHQAEDIALTHF